MKILLPLFLLISMGARSQEIAEDKVDEFTKIRSVATKPEKLSKKELLMATFSAVIDKADTLYALSLYYIPTFTHTVSDKSKLMILFESGEIEEYRSATDININYKGDVGYMSVFVPKSELGTLKSGRIKKLRVSTDDPNVDFDIDDKYRSVISSLVSFIQSKL